MGRKKSVWGARHSFSLNFLYPFKWIPWRRRGERENSVCLCHSSPAGRAGSIPEDRQQTAGCSCDTFLGLQPLPRVARRRQKARQVSADPKGLPESRSHPRRCPPLIETSPCPTATQLARDLPPGIAHPPTHSRPGHTSFPCSAPRGCRGRLPNLSFTRSPGHTGSHRRRGACCRLPPSISPPAQPKRGADPCRLTSRVRARPRALSVPPCCEHPAPGEATPHPTSAAHPTGGVPVASAPSERLCSCVPTNPAPASPRVPMHIWTCPRTHAQIQHPPATFLPWCPQGFTTSTHST